MITQEQERKTLLSECLDEVENTCNMFTSNTVAEATREVCIKAALIALSKMQEAHDKEMKEQQWISVEDDLPEFGLKVLIYGYPRKPLMEGRVIATDRRQEWEHLPKKGLMREQLEERLGFTNYTVTHWKNVELPKN